MAKIRLKNLPDGFEINNGKVVKKMQQGGMMTGDQSNYSLVTTPYNLMGNQFNNNKDSDIRYSLSSVPRDMANIEAEGGETVLTDLNNDGQFGLYNITGPRHGSGGVPMFLPEQSFVFSDTQKMKMNRQELAEFGIESRKKMTPAQISKKYQLNEFIGAMRDEDADPIKIKSAELMIDKNQKSLSKLAFGQEAKKNFADGVPLAAHPYLVMQGIDPIEFTQKVENITREQAAQRMFEGLSPEQQAQAMALRQMMEQAGQMQQPQAAYGKELPKAQNGYKGSLFGTMLNGTIPNTYGLGFQKSLPTRANNDWDGDGIPNHIDIDPYGVNQTRQNTTNSQANGSNPPANTNNTNSNARRPGGRVLDVSGVQGGKSLGSNYKQYEELERLFTSGEDTWNQTIDRAYTAFVANAKAQGISENQIPAKDAMMSQFLDYQKNNYMLADLLPDEYRYATELDRGSGDRKNKNTQALFNKAKELYPDIYSGYNIDENATKLNQLFFQAVTVADKDNAEPYLSYTATGPNQNTNWADNKTISKAEGFYGNNTLNQFLQVKEPITPPPPEPPKEGCPCEDGSYSMECCPKPGDTPRPVKGPDAKFWIQDLIKMGALAMRDRDMFLPWQPAVEIPKSGYVLEEPTRQLADVNEQFNIASQAIGAFAGPQSLNARIGQAAGNALKANANTFAQVHSRNIGTVNRGKLMDAQLEAAAKREQRDRSVKEYDDTQLTLQNYMDEKNLDREQMADLTANAYTNMANTYNLNTLYPYFNIDPVSGGMIGITANLPALVANKDAGKQLSPYDEMSSRALDLKAKGLDGTTINTILQNTYGTKAVADANTGADPYADVMRDVRAAGMPAGYPTAKKGKEIKKYAVPFYMGKIGY